MKEYALIGYLDKYSTEVFYGLKKQLYTLHLSDYFLENPIVHLTFCDFKEMNVALLKQIINELDSISQLKLTIAGIGSFTNSNIIFSIPIKTPQLVATHSQLYKIIKTSAISKNYAVDYWFPHLTIANRIDQACFSKAYKICQNELLLKEVSIQSIKVIEFNVDETGKILSHTTIYTKEMKNSIHVG